MRYYDIVIGDNISFVQNALAAGGGRFTSHPQGPNSPPDPGALQVEFDFPVFSGENTNVTGFLRIHGVSLRDISQASDLNPKQQDSMGKNIIVKGGMGKGLPLADPGQAGELVSGTVWQAYGNWIGTDQTLDIRIAPGTSRVPPGPDKIPQRTNLPWIWLKGTPLSQAIAQALSTGFPTYKQRIQIRSDFTLPYDEKGWFDSWTLLALYVTSTTKNIKNNDPNYHGVRIVLANDIFSVSDGVLTSGTPTKTISFIDLIGQPTWIELNVIQVTCPMRSDIHVNDYITLPPGLVTTTANSFSQFRQGSAFQGTFWVRTTRHVGSFRQSDPTAWVTVIEAITTPVPVPAGDATIENITMPPGVQ